MDNILNYPTSTHVDRLVPKTAFYKHLEINTRLKMRFVEDVERIQWLYKLAPSTMNVDEGKAVHEIVVFLVTLKVEDTLDDVFLAIDRQMPRYVVFVLQYANRSRLLLNYKEWADADKTRFNILKTFRCSSFTGQFILQCHNLFRVGGVGRTKSGNLTGKRFVDIIQ